MENLMENEMSNSVHIDQTAHDKQLARRKKSKRPNKFVKGTPSIKDLVKRRK
jgi:hypothetical protein